MVNFNLITAKKVGNAGKHDLRKLLGVKILNIKIILKAVPSVPAAPTPPFYVSVHASSVPSDNSYRIVFL